MASCSTRTRKSRTQTQAPLFVPTPTGEVPAVVVARNASTEEPAAPVTEQKVEVSASHGPAVKPAADTKEKPAKTEGKRSKPAAKPKAKAKGEGKGGNDKAANLPLEEARAAVLKALLDGGKERGELKQVAPFGDYTALMRGLEDDGLVKAMKESGRWAYVVSPKGRKQATSGEGK